MAPGNKSASGWTRATVGAVIASAALGGRGATPVAAHARDPRGDERPFPAAIVRVEEIVGPWERPQDVLAAAFRVGRAREAALGRQDSPSSLATGQGPAGTSSDAQTQTSPAFRFAIPAGPLGDALAAFTAVTGLAVRVAPDLIAGQNTAGVTGLLTPDQALVELLRGTALSHRLDAATRAVFVELRTSGETVDVSGAAPRVASRNYAGTLTETPQTIQVISRALIEEQGATTLSEALRNVSGITIQAGEGGGASSTTGDMFNMRGFTANNSLFVDGVRDDGLMSRDVYNLEQVEVFMGPTGSDVGRGTAAGYVNMTTKTPSRQAAYGASVNFGSAEAARATADINQPIRLGKAGSWLGQSAVRLNALWQDGGIPGRDHVGRESQSIAPSIGFGLESATRLSVAGQFTRQDNLPDYGVPAAASPVGTFSPAGVLAPLPVDQANYYGSPDYDYDKVEQDNVTVRLEHDVNARLSLRNQTRYNRTDRRAIVTSIQSPTSYVPETNLVTLSRQANERENEVTSNQTNLTARFSTGGLAHAASAGLELSHESQFAPTLAGAGTRDAVDLNNPDVFSPVTGYAPERTGAFSDGTTSTVALYAFDAVDLFSRLQLSGGVRLERYETKFLSVAATGLTTTDETARDTLFSGKAAVLYRLTDHSNIYLSYGTTATPPGTANFTLSSAPANQNNPNVDPQRSSNLEIGSKWDVAQGRLSLNAALFRTENTNVIFVVDAQAVPPIFNQDDGQTVKGFTLGAVGFVTPAWAVYGSFGYLDAIVDSQNPLNDGKRMTLTPEYSGSLWTTYTLPHDIRIGGGVRYTDAVFVNAANTLRAPGNTLVDALVEAPVHRRLILRLNVTNLTNEVYVRNVNNNGGRYNPGNPRAYLLSTVFRF